MSGGQGAGSGAVNDAQAVLDEAIKARDDLHRLVMVINNRIDEINVQALSQPGENLTGPQRAERDHLRASLREIGDTAIELGFVTMVKLSQSQEVANLKRDIEAVNKRLDDDLKRLKKIESIAAAAAKVAAQLPKVVAALAKIAAIG